MTTARRTAPRRLGAEVLAGLRALGFGFRVWGTSPGMMLLGALPALIVGAVFLGLFIWLVVELGPVTDALTPFADGWAAAWRDLVDVFAGAAIIVLAAAVMVVTYAAVTLAVGDPFYERIARRVEERLGDAPADRHEPVLRGIARAVGEGARVVALGVLLAVVLFLIGLIPVVGTIAAIVIGALFGGRLVVVELTGYAFEARGLHLRDRRRRIRARRVRAGMFGAVVYLLFLVPILAVFTMPAAVAGATALSRGLLDAAPAPRA